MTRSGFIAVVGRPNVGKSTLVNRMVGTKVAIASDKPQTTRRAIRGILTTDVNGEPVQLVLVDLPGVQKPRDTLTRRMQSRVKRELGDCDAVVLVINGAEEIGAGDRFIARSLISSGTPVMIAVNKLDVVDRGGTVEALFNAARLEDAGLRVRGVFPISALTGSGVDALSEALVALMPEEPFPFPEGEPYDQPRERRVAELIREQALARTREEIPHAVEVQVNEIERRNGITFVTATLVVETESQKGILVGRQGAMVKAIGSAARQQLQHELSDRVHLDLTVKVQKAWRRDDRMLDRLGIEG